jgi:hypothetical protein
MKVLIGGSNRLPINPTDKDKEDVESKKKPFRAACKAIGAALARKHHTIMVGVPNWTSLHQCRTVSNWVILGASDDKVKDKEKHDIVFYGPEESESSFATNQPNDTTEPIHTLQELQKLPNINLDVRGIDPGGQDQTMWYPDCAEVDAVVLIGGRDNTTTIGCVSKSLKKPCIAITSFGGAAEKLDHDILAHVYAPFIGQDKTLGGYLQTRSVNWGDDDVANQVNADMIVCGIEKLEKAYRETSEGRWNSWVAVTALISIALPVAWVAIWVRMGSSFISETIAFFLLLYIAALFGTGLRIIVTYRENRMIPVTPLSLMMDAAQSLILALGLALIYLIGGISFTGKVVVLEPNEAGVKVSDAFTTISLSMSLLGLAAGLLVPLDQLRHGLQRYASTETNKSG